MSLDVKDWNEKLSPEEKEIIGNILKSFTQTEIEVEDYWSGTVGKTFHKPEIKMMAAAFSNTETIHQDAYSYLNTVLNLENFKEFLQDEASMKKLEVLMSRNKKTDLLYKLYKKSPKFIKSILELKYNPEFKYRQEVAKSLAIFSVCAEGISLFSSFSILMSFKKDGKMPGVGQIVEWSILDENLHSEGGCKLFNTIIEEYPELKTEAFEDSIYEAVDATLNNEFYFIDQVFGGRNIPSITKEQVKNYMKHRANLKLKEINLAAAYDVDDVLLKEMEWFEVFSLGNRATDFFANQETAYSKANEDWNSDIF